MAIAFVQVWGTLTTKTSALTYTIAKTGAAATAGNGLIVGVGVRTNTTGLMSSVSDSQGNTYTQRASDVGAGSLNAVYVFDSRLTTGLGTGDTITLHFAGTAQTVVAASVLEITGTDPTFFAGNGATNGTSSSTTAVSLGANTFNFTKANGMCVAFVATAGIPADTFTAGNDGQGSPTTYTVPTGGRVGSSAGSAGSNNTIQPMYVIYSGGASPTAEDAKATLGTGRPWAVAAVEYDPLQAAASIPPGLGPVVGMTQPDIGSTNVLACW